MKFTIIFSIVFSLNFSLFAQHVQLSKIIERSKKYYSAKESGNVTIRSTFKSSIAESFQAEIISIQYCKEDQTKILSGEKYTSFLKKNKYYFIDVKNKKFIDYSNNKSFKQEKIDFINQYPQINTSFFERIKLNNFKIEIDRNFYHVFNLTDHYYFDTLNYSLIKYRNQIFTQYGLQIKEWEILNEKYFNSCKLPFFEIKFPVGYKKVASFGVNKNFDNLKGKNLKDLIAGPYNLDSGEPIFLTEAEGKHTLLDLFFQSCMPCIKSFPDLKQLYPYVDNNKLRIVGIDPVINDSASMKKFKSRYNLKHPIILGQQGAHLSELLNPKGAYPYCLLIDNKGIVVEVFEGLDEGLAIEVKKYLDASK